jgi:hypothetical protein
MGFDLQHIEVWLFSLAVLSLNFSHHMSELYYEEANAFNYFESERLILCKFKLINRSWF